MQEVCNMVAYDCGNSSVRTILCSYDGEKITSEVILQEPNGSIKDGELIYWDMPAVFASMKRGLALAARKAARIDSIGICTWGVDFQFLKRDGAFVERALCYRNTIGEEQLEHVNEEERRQMFYETGILCDKINSVYMIRGMREKMPLVMEEAAHLLMVPDIFVYMFTGVTMNEPSELTTTQMADVRTMEISRKMCDFAGVSPEIFSQVGEHGKVIGNVKKEILEELDITYDIPVICVPSHDTASAVMGMPAPENEYLFVSSGTWSLIGALCLEPVINEQTRLANLTNEGGPFGRTTLLRNGAGMYILQRLKAEYEETNGKISWNDFTALASRCSQESVCYDVNDSRFFNPARMETEISETLGLDASDREQWWPRILSETYASLGDSYAETLRQVQACTGRTYERVTVVGGGARNAKINQRCADRLGMEVVACEMECASIGNAAVQLAYFHPEYTFETLRQIVCRSLTTKVYRPGSAAAEQ